MFSEFSKFSSMNLYYFIIGKKMLFLKSHIFLKKSICIYSFSSSLSKERRLLFLICFRELFFNWVLAYFFHLLLCFFLLSLLINLHIFHLRTLDWFSILFFHQLKLALHLHQKNKVKTLSSLIILTLLRVRWQENLILYLWMFLSKFSLFCS